MQTITLQVNEHDYTMILGALRECVAAIEMGDLQIRVGGTTSQLTTLIQKIRAQGDAQGAEE